MSHLNPKWLHTTTSHAQCTVDISYREFHIHMEPLLILLKSQKSESYSTTVRLHKIHHHSIQWNKTQSWMILTHFIGCICCKQGWHPSMNKQCHTHRHGSPPMFFVGHAILFKVSYPAKFSHHDKIESN